MSKEIDVTTWRVLIVDDDDDNLGVAAEYLAYLGADVRTAVDGIDGLDVLREFKPTLILLDLSMPNMDGWQMLKAVRKMPEYAAIPVIALTAHAMSADRTQVFDEGFDGYITKPFLLSSFLQLITRWLVAEDTDDASRAGGSS